MKQPQFNVCGVIPLWGGGNSEFTTVLPPMIIGSNGMACNGIIHALDGVILPELEEPPTDAPIVVDPTPAPVGSDAPVIINPTTAAPVVINPTTLPVGPPVPNPTAAPITPTTRQTTPPTTSPTKKKK